jgi:hypothetical protein
MGTRIPGTRIRSRISGYLPGSPRSVSDPNPKLQYPGITRIRPKYKNTRIHIRKNGYLYYSYLVPDLFSPLLATCKLGERSQGEICGKYFLQALF